MKRSLAQLRTPANIQNNYIKLSTFTFRLDFCTEESSSTPKNLSQLLLINLTNVHFPPFNCTLKWYWQLDFLREGRKLPIKELRG